MAVSYVSSSSNKSTTASVVVTAPSGITNDDIMILTVSSFKATNSTPGTITASGWTQIYARATATRYLTAIFYKRCSSESGNYTVTSTSANQMNAAIGLYRGCILTGSPIDVSSDTPYLTSDTNIRGATITPTLANGFFIYGGWYYLAGTITLANPTGMNDRQVQLNTNNALRLSDLAYTTTSASGNKDGISGASATVKHAYLLALKPSVATDLVINDNVHSHLSDNVDISVIHNVLIDDNIHYHLSDNVATTQDHSITGVSDNIHSHLSDSVSITQDHNLAIDSNVHEHISDGGIIIEQISSSVDLFVNENIHSHISDSVNITQVHALLINGNIHSHLSDNVSIIQEHILTINDNVHSHASDNVSITQVHNLIVDSNIHAHISDGDIVIQQIVGTLPIDLIINDNIHGQISDSLSITQIHNLQIFDNIHEHTSDLVNLTQNHNLQVNDNIHVLISDDVGLIQIHYLIIYDNVHRHISDNIDIYQYVPEIVSFYLYLKRIQQIEVNLQSDIAIKGKLNRVIYLDLYLN